MKLSYAFIIFAVILTGCSPASTSSTITPASTSTPPPPTYTPTMPPPTATATPQPTHTPRPTPDPAAIDTAAIVSAADLPGYQWGNAYTDYGNIFTIYNTLPLSLETYNLRLQIINNAAGQTAGFVMVIVNEKESDAIVRHILIRNAYVDDYDIINLGDEAFAVAKETTEPKSPYINLSCV